MMVLTALGVYGVLRHAVGKRTREIGIRRALREGLSVACAGVLAGIAGASGRVFCRRFCSACIGSSR
jgi:hypothetical protein